MWREPLRAAEEGRKEQKRLNQTEPSRFPCDVKGFLYVSEVKWKWDEGLPGNSSVVSFNELYEWNCQLSVDFKSLSNLDWKTFLVKYSWSNGPVSISIFNKRGDSWGGGFITEIALNPDRVQTSWLLFKHGRIASENSFF